MAGLSHGVRFAIGIALALTACTQDASDRPTPAPDARPAVGLVPSSRTIADVSAQVMPSVVSVWSVAITDDSDGLPSALLQAAPSEVPVGGMRRLELNLGSGVILSPDGVILTNEHVISGARKIRVATQDGHAFDARLVGTDPATDVAVLRFEARGLPPIHVAQAPGPRIGDVVLVIGNPFGLGETVTMGIVSGLGRANLGLTEYDDFIQTDAAINPGNSGGALIDMSGRLVGVPTAILSRTGGYEGIGFAIPAAKAVRIANELVAHGKVIRGWLGAALKNSQTELARVLLHDATRVGVVVSDVTTGSPAERAGLRPGDQIKALDGTEVSSASQLRDLLTSHKPGTVVRLEIEHGHVTRTLAVTLGDEPGS